MVLLGGGGTQRGWIRGSYVGFSVNCLASFLCVFCVDEFVAELAEFSCSPNIEIALSLHGPLGGGGGMLVSKCPACGGGGDHCGHWTYGTEDLVRQIVCFSPPIRLASDFCKGCIDLVRVS